MLISHSRRFILFPDPLGTCDWVGRAVEPWIDQPLSSGKSATPFFEGMSPFEAEWSFDMMGLAFRSYTRISIFQNPFTRMARLYDRIVKTDRLWQLRERAGFGTPDFTRWLRSTRPDGLGAGSRNSPRWRKYGAWSNDAWCGDRIDHVIRAEFVEHDLAPVFAQLGITPDPSVRFRKTPDLSPFSERYDDRARRIMEDRYGADLALFNCEAQPFHVAA